MSKGQTSDDSIQLVLRAALGDLLDWERPKLMSGVGPQHPKIFFDYERLRDEWVTAATKILEALEPEFLRENYFEPTAPKLYSLTNRHGLHSSLAKQLEELKKRRPPWFAAGWSNQDHLLDVPYWSSVHSLDREEATLLIVGVEPRGLLFDTLFYAYGRDKRTDEVLYYLEDVHELVIRRFGDPKKTDELVHVADFAQWLSETKTKISPQLKEVVSNWPKLGGARAGHSAMPRRSVGGVDRLHGHSRSAFQKALLCAAVTGLGLRKEKDASRIAKRIVDQSVFLGLDISERFVKNALKAGYVQLANEVQKDLENGDLP